MYSIHPTIKVFFALSILIFASCKKKDTPQAVGANRTTASTLAVQTQIAENQSLKSDIEVPGSILPFESTDIQPEISGRIVQLNIQEGAQVAQGALLAKLYDGDLQAQLRKLEVQLEIAQKTEMRQAELLKIQGISQQDYDLSLLQVKSLLADIEIIREDIRKTEIRAPFSGRLGLKKVSPGAYVSPSSVLTTINQVNNLKLQFSVPERYSPELRNGMEVNFRVDGSDKMFTASVMATESSVDESTRSLAVRALVKDKDPALIPGAFAKVRLTLSKSNEAIMVPNSAIIPVGRTKQLFVYEGGKAMVREVVTGVRDSTNIQVLSGLRPGDTIITSAVLYLRPGMDISIIE